MLLADLYPPGGNGDLGPGPLDVPNPVPARSVSPGSDRDDGRHADRRGGTAFQSRCAEPSAPGDPAIGRGVTLPGRRGTALPSAERKARRNESP